MLLNTPVSAAPGLPSSEVRLQSWFTTNVTHKLQKLAQIHWWKFSNQRNFRSAVPRLSGPLLTDCLRQRGALHRWRRRLPWSKGNAQQADLIRTYPPVLCSTSGRLLPPVFGTSGWLEMRDTDIGRSRGSAGPAGAVWEGETGWERDVDVALEKKTADAAVLTYGSTWICNSCLLYAAIVGQNWNKRSWECHAAAHCIKSERRPVCNCWSISM